MARLAIVAVAVSAACSSGRASPGGDPSPAPLVDEVVVRPDLPPIPPFGECVVTTARIADPSGAHVPTCADVTYDTVPPVHGDHYSEWADFRDYDGPVPWGFLVHALEHGAVVLGRSCDADCRDVPRAFAAVVQALPPDQVCAENGRPDLRRAITVFDPDLDVPIVAAAWGRLYRATCLDEASLAAFARGAYRSGPEDLCFPGEDRGSRGWCP